MTEQASGVIPQFTRGDRLRKARQLTGLTTREFAETIGVSQKTITDAEGDRVTPRKITLLAYAMRTGVPLAWLLTGHAENPRPDDPDGGDEQCAARDSNPEPAVLHQLQGFQSLAQAA